jgi:hypothetical protein
MTLTDNGILVSVGCVRQLDCETAAMGMQLRQAVLIQNTAQFSQ